MSVGDVLLREQSTAPIQIVFRDSTDFAPTAANDLRFGSPTLVQLDLTSVANGSYRQSTKVDLGALRAPAYAVRAALEFAATPTAGNIVELWWAPSSSGTAGVGNPAAASGADSAYTGYSANPDAAVQQAQRIGVFVCTAQATATIQVGEVIGYLVPPERYGSLIVKNGSGAAMHSDAVEMHVTFDPLVEQTQAS